MNSPLQARVRRLEAASVPDRINLGDVVRAARESGPYVADEQQCRARCIAALSAPDEPQGPPFSRQWWRRFVQDVDRAQGRRLLGEA